MEENYKEETAKDLKKKFTYLETQRSYWDKGIWQDICDYVIPIREDLQGLDVPGKIQGTKIYDGTAVSALNLFADGLHGYMISPAIKWFNFRLPRQLRYLEKIPEVREFIQDTEATIYSALQNSNFYSEMRPYFKDGGSIGTASLHCEEDVATGKLVFTTLHPREGFIAEDKFGDVDTFFRKIKLTARQIDQSFGREKVSLLLQNAIDKRPYDEFEMLHAVFPRSDYDKRKLSSTNKKYASIWTEFKKDNVVRESGYDMFPYMVWRYAKSGNEVYGRSPAAYALPEIKALNSISKDLVGAAQMSVRPPYNIPVEMKGKVRLTPMGMNYYGNDYNRKVSPINTGITFPFALDREEKKMEVIEKHFHVDFFLMLQRAERQMTATEIMERMGEKASVLSASIGDLTTVLDKILDYVFQIELNAKRILLPEALMAAGGSNIDIVYMGPLAQAQKRLFETQGIRNGMELAAPLLSIWPETIDLINADETIKELLISNGFPQTALNAPDVVMKLRQSKAQQKDQQEKQINMQMFAEIMKDLAQADKNSGGKLAEMIQGVGGGAIAE